MSQKAKGKSVFDKKEKSGSKKQKDAALPVQESVNSRTPPCRGDPLKPGFAPPSSAAGAGRRARSAARPAGGGLLVVDERDLVPEELDELHEAFVEFDEDSDGFVSCKDLGECMRTMGFMPTEMELIEISQQIKMRRECAAPRSIPLISERVADCRRESQRRMANESGASMFIGVSLCYRGASVFGVSLSLTGTFDRDGDGMITRSEFREALKHLLGEQLNTAEVDEILKDIDD
ncbi:calcium-binding protein 2-like [Polyodon spathula]|uniref:calcium-binding protein 2-like n=1 Tax=Polyodon spathula TaxID=7913 RepID=UPI001B7E6889|nr:calcium-binding protein 2-like [Polyodon spathula]